MIKYFIKYFKLSLLLAVFFFNTIIRFFKYIYFNIHVILLYIKFFIKFSYNKLFKKRSIVKETKAAGRKIKYFGLIGYILVWFIRFYYLFLRFLIWFDIFIDRLNYAPSFTQIFNKYKYNLYLYLRLYRFTELDYYKEVLDSKSKLSLFIFIPFLFCCVFVSDYIILIILFTFFSIFLLMFGLVLLGYSLNFKLKSYLKKIQLLKEVYIFNIFIKILKYKYSFYNIGLERRRLRGRKPIVKNNK